MGERTVLESIWNTVACNDLLTNASNHLCDVDDGTYRKSADCKKKRWSHQTFGTTGSHDQRRVVAAQFLETDLADLVADLGQDTRYHSFERLLLVTTRLVFQQTLLSSCDEILALGVRLRNKGFFLVRQLWSRNDVVDAEGESVVCYVTC